MLGRKGIGEINARGEKGGSARVNENTQSTGVGGKVGVSHEVLSFLSQSTKLSFTELIQQEFNAMATRGVLYSTYTFQKSVLPATCHGGELVKSVGTLCWLGWHFGFVASDATSHLNCVSDDTQQFCRSLGHSPAPGHVCRGCVSWFMPKQRCSMGPDGVPGSIAILFAGIVNGLIPSTQRAENPTGNPTTKDKRTTYLEIHIMTVLRFKPPWCKDRDREGGQYFNGCVSSAFSQALRH